MNSAHELPTSILHVDLASCSHEEEGFRLFSQMSALVRDAVPQPEGGRGVPPGPGFDYGACPELFLGRRGLGPLHVAWDTNLLVSYFANGEALWSGETLPDEGLGDYGDELEALQIVVALWVMRDIRFHILRGTLSDSKSKPLPPGRLSSRRAAFGMFSTALSLGPGYGDPEDGEQAGDLLVLPESELERALRRVPAGNDRLLVNDAVRQGLNVFLTGDKKVLRARDALRPFGLILASPGDLLELLAASGSLHCMWGGEYLYWPAPDQYRVAQLVHALIAASDEPDA